MATVSHLVNEIRCFIKQGDLITAEEYLEELICRYGASYAHRHGLLDELFEARRQGSKRLAASG